MAEGTRALLLLSMLPVAAGGWLLAVFGMGMSTLQAVAVRRLDPSAVARGPLVATVRLPLRREPRTVGGDVVETESSRFVFETKATGRFVMLWPLWARGKRWRAPIHGELCLEEAVLVATVRTLAGYRVAIVGSVVSLCATAVLFVVGRTRSPLWLVCVGLLVVGIVGTALARHWLRRSRAEAEHVAREIRAAIGGSAPDEVLS